MATLARSQVTELNRSSTEEPAVLLEAIGRALSATRVLVLPRGAQLPEPQRSVWRRREPVVLSIDIPDSDPPRQVVLELPEPPTPQDRLVAHALVRTLSPRAARPAPPRQRTADPRAVIEALAAPEDERVQALLESVVSSLRGRSGALALTGDERHVWMEGTGRPILHRAAVEALKGPDGQVEILHRTFLTRQLRWQDTVIGGLALEGVSDSPDLRGYTAMLAAVLRPAERPRTEETEPQESSPGVQAMLAALPVAALALDPEGRLVGATPDAESLFSLTDFDLGVPMEGRLAGLSVRGVLRGDGVPTDLEVGDRWFEPTATALPQGGWLLVFVDRSATDELHKAQEGLVAAMSHELRTPVAAVKTLLEVLKNPRVREDADRLQGLLEEGSREVSRLERLVEDLLLSARLATGGIVARADDIQLRPVVEDLARQMTHRYPDRTFDVRGEAPGHGDPGLLRHVVWHLLDNAAKFSPPGSAVTVEIDASSEGAEVLVTDTGEGIFSGDIPELFLPFKRLDRKATSQHGGAGIGLYLVKAVLDAQGGKVWVRSRLGKGSTFGFRIPPARSA